MGNVQAVIGEWRIYKGEKRYGIKNGPYDREQLQINW